MILLFKEQEPHLDGATPSALTKLTISVAAFESDKDALLEGGSFVDPVFGSFKLDFSSLNIPVDNSARETIKVEIVETIDFLLHLQITEEMN